MNTRNNLEIFGCFVSGQPLMAETNQIIKDKVIEKNALFRSYIWGEAGICTILNKFILTDYGDDLNLILFQFYLNPIPFQLQHLKEILNYRKNEKSIAVTIVITDENFFFKSNNERGQFLRDTIFMRLKSLTVNIKKKKLDTKMEKLISDLQEKWVL